MAKKKRAEVAIDLAMPCKRWRARLRGVGALVRKAAHAALAAGPNSRAEELSLVLADDKTLRALNKRWRGKDRPTNVLSFPAEDESSAVPLLGDVVLAYETVAREAKEQGKSLADHLTHLVIHGVLHLLGMDHEQSAAAAKRMEKLEIRILKGLGIADPYETREIARG